MFLSSQGFNYILFATWEILNYVICKVIQKANAVTIAEALLNRVIYQCGPLKTLMIDEDSTFCKCFNAYSKYLKYQMTSNFSIESLIIRSERFARLVIEMLCKVLKRTGEDWHLYVNPCCNTLNTYVSSLTEYSAFELAYLHKPVDLTHIEYSALQHL